MRILQVYTDVSAYVTSLVEGLIGGQVAQDQPFMEAGLDSLGAVELRNTLATRYSLDLPASLIFDYPTVAALSSFLVASMQPMISQGVQYEPAETLGTVAAAGGAEVVSIACKYPGSEGDCFVSPAFSVTE